MFFILYIRKLKPRDTEKLTENHTATTGLQSHLDDFSVRTKLFSCVWWLLMSSQLPVLESLLKSKKQNGQHKFCQK